MTTGRHARRRDRERRWILPHEIQAGTDRYTRAGAFDISRDGNLVDKSGALIVNKRRRSDHDSHDGKVGRAIPQRDGFPVDGKLPDGARSGTLSVVSLF